MGEEKTNGEFKLGDKSYGWYHQAGLGVGCTTIYSEFEPDFLIVIQGRHSEDSLYQMMVMYHRGLNEGTVMGIESSTKALRDALGIKDE